jgi:hypothetical protein
MLTDDGPDPSSRVGDDVWARRDAIAISVLPGKVS